MSSTNRASERSPADYYVTPQWAIKQVFAALCEDAKDVCDFSMDQPLYILDPCAGGDAKREMAYPSMFKALGRNDQITTVDIRKDSRAEWAGVDYLKVRDIVNGWDRAYDMVITNPPFNIALNIINAAFLDVRDGGLVVMLQRLNFFGSRERSAWFEQNMPVLTYVHSKRMRFAEGTHGDSIEYAHFVWKSGVKPRFTQLRVLPYVTDDSPKLL